LYGTPIENATSKLNLPASPFPPPKSKAEAHALADSIGSAVSPQGRKKMRKDALKAKSSKERIKRNHKKSGKKSAGQSPPTSARAAALHSESSHKKSASVGSFSP
jgi:hypothetical protein